MKKIDITNIFYLVLGTVLCCLPFVISKVVGILLIAAIVILFCMNLYLKHMNKQLEDLKEQIAYEEERGKQLDSMLEKIQQDQQENLNNTNFETIRAKLEETNSNN